MFVCVVPLSQPSSRDLLYVKCLCVLSRYLSPVVEICYMLNVVCVVPLSQPVVEICYMLNVCVCCPVISASSRDLLYVKCLCVLSRYLSPVVEICYMLNVCACCPVISAQ